MLLNMLFSVKSQLIKERTKISLFFLTQFFRPKKCRGWLYPGLPTFGSYLLLNHQYYSGTDVQPLQGTKETFHFQAKKE